MSNPITRFFFTATGAFIIWLTKGFKGPFDNEMVAIDERNSTKGTLRFFLGLGIWILVAIITIKMLTRRTDSYGSETNQFEFSRKE